MNTDHYRGYLRYDETQPAKVKEFNSTSRTSLRGGKASERNNVSLVRKKRDTPKISNSTRDTVFQSLGHYTARTNGDNSASSRLTA